MYNLYIDDMCEVARFLEVVEAFHLHALSRDFVGHLITPLVHNRHVDVVDEDGHSATSRRTERASHSLLDVALHRSLNMHVHVHALTF